MEQQGLPMSLAVLFGVVILAGMGFVGLIVAVVISASPGL